MDTFELVRAILIVAAAYLIGGIPWSIIVARLTGRTDPRTIGSGRTGGANAMRAMGPRLALLSGILDLLKGTAAVLLARWLGAGVEVEVFAGLAAIVGHSRSPFLGFGGGRGVAPAFGGLLAFSPVIAAIIIPLFIVVIAVTRYSSVGLADGVGGRGRAARRRDGRRWAGARGCTCTRSAGRRSCGCSTGTTSSACSPARNGRSARPRTGGSTAGWPA